MLDLPVPDSRCLCSFTRMTDKDLLRYALDALCSGREYKRGTCYRCWQVGHEGVSATCIVLYNAGTEHEWKNTSCAECARSDMERFPNATKIIAQIILH